MATSRPAQMSLQGHARAMILLSLIPRQLYTEKQIERLKYLIKTLGCCRSNNTAKKYIQTVWMKVPEARGGGLGLGLDIDSSIYYIRRSIYGSDETGLSTQRQMKRFKAWAMKQPESRALSRPSRSTTSSSQGSTIIDLATEERAVDPIGARLCQTATTFLPTSSSTTPSIQAPAMEATPASALPVVPSSREPSPPLPPPTEPPNQPSWVWVCSNVDPIEYLSMTPGLLKFLPRGGAHGFYGVMYNQASALPYLMRTPGLVELRLQPTEN